MKSKWKQTAFVLFLFVLLGLVGCGSGSDSSVSSSTPSGDTPEYGGNPGKEYIYNGVSFYGQCVWAARQYYNQIYDIFVPYISVGNLGAYHLWDIVQPSSVDWIRIPNTGSNTPNMDDMIIMKPWGANPYGHVCVMVRMVDASRRIAEVVDSNWNYDEAGGKHNITLDDRVYGWYRPRQNETTPPSTQPDIPGNSIDEDGDGQDTPLTTLQRCYKNVSYPGNYDWSHQMVPAGSFCNGELDGHGFGVISNNSGVEILDLGSGYKAARLYECHNASISEYRYTTVEHRMTGSGWTCSAMNWYVGTAASITDLGGTLVYEGYIPSKTTYLYGPSEDLSVFGGSQTPAFWGWNVH